MTTSIFEFATIQVLRLVFIIFCRSPLSSKIMPILSVKIFWQKVIKNQL